MVMVVVIDGAASEIPDERVLKLEDLLSSETSPVVLVEDVEVLCDAPELLDSARAHLLAHDQARAAATASRRLLVSTLHCHEGEGSQQRVSQHEHAHAQAREHGGTHGTRAAAATSSQRLPEPAACLAGGSGGGRGGR